MKYNVFSNYIAVINQICEYELKPVKFTITFLDAYSIQTVSLGGVRGLLLPLMYNQRALYHRTKRAKWSAAEAEMRASHIARLIGVGHGQD